MTGPRAVGRTTNEGGNPLTSLNPRVATAALLLATALVAAACGSTTTTAPDHSVTTQPTAAPNDAGDADSVTGGGACDLVDPALAAEALGEPVDPGSAEAEPASGFQICTYRTTGSGNWLAVQVTSSIRRDDWDSQQATSHMDQAGRAVGLGEIAYLLVDGSTGLRLAAFGDGHAVEVLVAKKNMDVHRTLAPEEIVRTVLLAVG